MANDKLNAVIKCVARIQLMTEGGWQYSSPLVREQGGEAVPVMATPDALSIVALMVTDIDQLSSELFRLTEEAKELGIDPVSMCAADVPMMARVYQQLAMDLSSAAQRAIEGFKQPVKPERRKRSNGAGPSAQQTSLLGGESEPPEAQ